MKPRSGTEPWMVVNPNKGFADGLPQPDWLLASKADLYDVTGAVAEFTSGSGSRNEMTLPAFVIWRKKPK